MVNWSESEVEYKQRIFDLIANICYFFKGSIGYNDIMSMPIDDLEHLIISQNKIAKQNNVISS